MRGLPCEIFIGLLISRRGFLKPGFLKLGSDDLRRFRGPVREVFLRFSPPQPFEIFTVRWRRTYSLVKKHYSEMMWNVVFTDMFRKFEMTLFQSSNNIDICSNKMKRAVENVDNNFDWFHESEMVKYIYRLRSE